MERHLSPACQWDYKLLQAGDIATGAAGIASGAVLITAGASIAALPVAPVVVAGAMVVGAFSGAWALGRSAYALYDRRKHNEVSNVNLACTSLNTRCSCFQGYSL